MSGTWSTVELAGRPAELFDPETVSEPALGIIFLHGIGLETLNDRPAFTRVLAELGISCICPHGERSWWSDRLCPEFAADVTAERYLLDAVVPFIRQEWHVGPSRTGLLGISMGGQGALRLAFKYPRQFTAVAAISAALDYHELYGHGTTIDLMYDSKEQCRQDTVPMHLHPGDYPPHIFFCVDPDDTAWVRGNDRLREKLRALSIPHQCDLNTRAGGHSWEYFNHMADPAIRFLHRGLSTQSYRLL